MQLLVVVVVGTREQRWTRGEGGDGDARRLPTPSRPPPHTSPQFSMRRVAVGIWTCKACNKTVAGGAYVYT